MAHTINGLSTNNVPNEKVLVNLKNDS